jgi:hypothetical protein
MAANWPKRIGQAWPWMFRAIDRLLLTEARWTAIQWGAVPATPCEIASTDSETCFPMLGVNIARRSDPYNFPSV